MRLRSCFRIPSFRRIEFVECGRRFLGDKAWGLGGAMSPCFNWFSMGIFAAGSLRKQVFHGAPFGANSRIHIKKYNLLTYINGMTIVAYD